MTVGFVFAHPVTTLKGLSGVLQELVLQVLRHLKVHLPLNEAENLTAFLSVQSAARKPGITEQAV